MPLLVTDGRQWKQRHKRDKKPFAIKFTSTGHTVGHRRRVTTVTRLRWPTVGYMSCPRPAPVLVANSFRCLRDLFKQLAYRHCQRLVYTFDGLIFGLHDTM